MLNKILLTILFALFVADSGYAASTNKLMRKGNKFYKKGDYLSALENYQNASIKSKENKKIKFNIGNALYRLDDFKKAQTLWEESTKDQKIKSKAYYNEGNAYFRQSQYKEAVQSYINAILSDPNDSNAKHNLQIALEKLKISQKQCSQKKDNQGNQQKNENQQKKEGQDDKPKDEKKSQAMSKENAERLLEMMKEKEKESAKPEILNQRFKKGPRPQEQVEKDW